MHKKKKRRWNGAGHGDGTRPNVWLTSTTVASLNRMPEESIGSTISVSLLHLEAIRVNWQHYLDRLSIAKCYPSRAVITEHTQIRRVAAVLCPSRVWKTVVV